MPEDQTLAEYWQEQSEELDRWFATQAVLDDIASERRAQHEQWGDQVLPMGTSKSRHGRNASNFQAICRGKAETGDLTYSDILLEEVFEALAEEDPLKLKDELVQVAAVAVKMVELINREQEADGAAAP